MNSELNLDIFTSLNTEDLHQIKQEIKDGPIPRKLKELIADIKV